MIILASGMPWPLPVSRRLGSAPSGNSCKDAEPLHRYRAGAALVDEAT